MNGDLSSYLACGQRSDRGKLKVKEEEEEEEEIFHLFCCCGCGLGERADLRESTTDVRLHPARRVPVQSIGELGAARRRILLLHYAINNRVRRLRAGHQPRLVALAEERRVWSLPRLRPRAHCYVFQLDAGRGAEQVSTPWTPSWSHQIETGLLEVRGYKKILRYCTLRAFSSPNRRSRCEIRNLYSDNDIGILAIAHHQYPLTFLSPTAIT